MTDLRPVFSFLNNLAVNNDRAWFEAHRSEYDLAKQTVEDFVFGLFPALGMDRGGHKASHWFHRIYRDVRFAKEKTPYKVSFSCNLHPGGKKAPGLGPYVHFQPANESLVAGGLWAPEAAVLKKFRLDMEDGPRAFLKVVESPEFRSRLTFLDGDKLKKVPKGFPEDHPAAELLKLKQVVAWKTLTDDQVLAPDFGDRLVATIQALRPFLHYLEDSTGLVNHD